MIRPCSFLMRVKRDLARGERRAWSAEASAALFTRSEEVEGGGVRVRRADSTGERVREEVEVERSTTFVMAVGDTRLACAAFGVTC